MKTTGCGTLVRQCSDTELKGTTDSQQGRYGLALIDSLPADCDEHERLSVQQ